MIRAVDGSTVEVDGIQDPPRWAFRAWYRSRRTGVSAIMTTDAGASENSPLPDAHIVSEARAGSARLLALADPDRERHPTTTFVYQGPFHELYTTQAGVDIPMDAFVDFLKPLDISDSPEGMQAVPKRGSDATVDLQVGAAVIEDVAVLTSYFSSQALREVPSHRGRQVRGGELWRIESPVGVLIANDSVATRAEPIRDPNDPAFVALAESLRVARRPA